MPQWCQRLGNFGGGWIDAKRKVSCILGDGSHLVGSRGEDPIRGLVDEPPKLILILEMDVKLIFYGGKNRKCMHVSLFS